MDDCISSFYKYVSEDLLKPINMEEKEKYVLNDFLIQYSGMYYSVKEFTKILLQLNPDFIRNICSVLQFYYDENENQYWRTEENYHKYIESKKSFEEKGTRK